MTPTMPHKDFMMRAIKLAQSGLGITAPNPSVGALIVKDGSVIAEGRTAIGGRPHAEPIAIEQARDPTEGATLYVTLEPCNTHGKTPPCVDKIIKAGISSVYIACLDLFQQNKNSKSIEKMRAAGIEVTIGLCSEEAYKLYESFFKYVETSLPSVSLKIATTLDGKIATRTGHSQWITNEKSRQKTHEIRAQHDAILIGTNTLKTDNPTLTVRHVNPEKQPLRIVIDRDLKHISQATNLLNLDHAPTAVIHDAGTPTELPKGLESIALKTTNNLFDIEEVLKALGNKGVRRLMVEGGGVTLAHFIKSKHFDKLYWFRAPIIGGSDARSAIGELGFDTVSQMPILHQEHHEMLSEDCFEIWAKKQG